MTLEDEETHKILYQFPLWFSIQFTYFSLMLDLFDPTFLQNFISDWMQFRKSRAEPSYRKFGEVPPPLTRLWGKVTSILYNGVLWHSLHTYFPGSVTAIKSGYPSQLWELKTTPFSRGFFKKYITFSRKNRGFQALKWPPIRGKTRGFQTEKTLS